ncbi:hypothetical protein [Bradyrhizobium sp.]|nr:hypothetical protein [Bradyrhizobium sp.]
MTIAVVVIAVLLSRYRSSHGSNRKPHESQTRGVPASMAVPAASG